MNTAEKIKVMQKQIGVMQEHVDGKMVVSRPRSSCEPKRLVPDNPQWDWRDNEYFVMPETLEEAAIGYIKNSCQRADECKAFIAGAKWQQERSGESDGD